MGEWITDGPEGKAIFRIPLRDFAPRALTAEEVTLQPGDVVFVPRRRAEVFFVVGEVDVQNNTRFFSGDDAREYGGGYLLPRDRDVDVVTAVAMAGYIDPIDSPTTVTVQRQRPGGPPLLIRVDLIRARRDRRENLMIAAGDIIYLNPDSWWYFRRTFDRLLVPIVGNLTDR